MCSCKKKKWIMLGLVLAVLVVLALVTVPVQGPETPPPEVTLPNETKPIPEEPPMTEPPVTEPKISVPTVVTAPEGFTEALNGELTDQQRWFFDFAIAYRLDEMPTFTEEDGPPADAGEYLYWAFTVHYDEFRAEPAYWPEGCAIMDTAYVEGIVARHFGLTPGNHTTVTEQWIFDPNTGIYTAYPTSLMSPPLYLLTGLEFDPEQNTVTAQAVSYLYHDYHGMEIIDDLRRALLQGNTADYTASYQVTVKFRLDPETREALILSLDRIDLPDPPDPTDPSAETLFPEDLELTVPERLPEQLGTTPLELQEWFFDFAIDYRLDYMTTFTAEAGAPTDSGEYLYWISTIHSGAYHTSERHMTARDVEEIAARYFDVSVVDHRSHFKSWSFDPDTGEYSPWPEGLRSHPLCLLRDLEYDPESRIVTVWAECYDYIHHYDNLQVPTLRAELLYGEKADLNVRYQIMLQFHLDPDTLEPLFLSHERIDMMYPYRN